MEITNAVQLKRAIALLETDTALKKTLMIGQFQDTRDSLKPVNLIKNALTKIVHAPDIVNQVVGTSIGMGAGALSKKILIGKPTNIFKKILGTVIQLFVSNAVAKKL